MAPNNSAGGPDQRATRPLSFVQSTTTNGSESNPPTKARQHARPLRPLFKVKMPTGRALTIPIDLAEDVAAAIADARNADLDRGLL
jgi:hypothetical protein